MQSSNNGTLFHYRSFLTYHIDRKFEDHSLIFEKKGKMIAIFSAVELEEKSNKILHSHPGATFGSLVYNKTFSFKDALDTGELLITYAKENNFSTIKVTLSPSIYSLAPSDYFEFSLLNTPADPLHL